MAAVGHFLIQQFDGMQRRVADYPWECLPGSLPDWPLVLRRMTGSVAATGKLRACLYRARHAGAIHQHLENCPLFVVHGDNDY